MKENVLREDLSWADTGDFIFSGGDLQDTREKRGKGFIEEVSLRIGSSFNDLKIDPDKGANISEAEGMNNVKSTWDFIIDNIKYSLTKDAFLGLGDFEVNVAPVSVFEVAVRIDFSDNIKRLIDPAFFSVKVIYNLDGKGPFIMRN